MRSLDFFNIIKGKSDEEKIFDLNKKINESFEELKKEICKEIEPVKQEQMNQLISRQAAKLKKEVRETLLGKDKKSVEPISKKSINRKPQKEKNASVSRLPKENNLQVVEESIESLQKKVDEKNAYASEVIHLGGSLQELAFMIISVADSKNAGSFCLRCRTFQENAEKLKELMQKYENCRTQRIIAISQSQKVLLEQLRLQRFKESILEQYREMIKTGEKMKKLNAGNEMPEGKELETIVTMCKSV